VASGKWQVASGRVARAPSCRTERKRRKRKKRKKKIIQYRTVNNNNTITITIMIIIIITINNHHNHNNHTKTGRRKYRALVILIFGSLGIWGCQRNAFAGVGQSIRAQR
jgi:hypothetical protein